jgi:DNA-binding response OmpR family regulator
VATVDSVRDALAILTRERGGGAAEGESDGKEEFGVDLILTDITLTGQRSGLDLAAEAGTLGIPVLFATAVPPEGGEKLAIGVLLKPYSERTLRAALKAVERRLAGKARNKAPEGFILYDKSLAA